LSQYRVLTRSSATTKIILGLTPSVFAGEPKIAVTRKTIGSTTMLVDPKPITVGQRLGVIQCAGPYLLTTAVAHYIGASVFLSSSFVSEISNVSESSACIFYMYLLLFIISTIVR
jgi:hypothetical protein